MTTQTDKNIPEGWRETTLEEVVDLAQGIAINTKTDYVLCKESEGLPLLKINNLVNNTVDQWANPSLVTKKAILSIDDVIFTRTGQVGWVFTGKIGILHNNSFKVIPKDLLNKKYLYWFLKQKSIYDYVQKVASGSAQPDLNHDAFKTINIILPPLPEQQAIADILSSLDAKIELLREQNQTLEKTAQTIFQEWFGKYSVECPEGLPEGWRVGKLGEVAKLIAGGDNPKNATVNKTDTNTIPIFSNGISNDGLYGYTDIPRIMEESVTVSARGTIGYVSLKIEPYVPIVRLIAIVPNKTYISSKYLFLWLKNENISGTGTTQQQITIPSFSNQEIIIPESGVMDDFTKLLESFYEKIFTNISQIQSLSKTRDELLPRLMCGEVGVN